MLSSRVHRSKATAIAELQVVRGAATPHQGLRARGVLALAGPVRDSRQDSVAAALADAAP